MKGDADIMQLYQQRYKEALDLLKIQVESRMNVDEYRNGMIRMIS
jgi:hypothetical protein